MHLIAADSSDGGPEAMVKKLNPHALHRQGEVVDVAFRNGAMNTVREWCKRARDTGVMVGVATHKPEVIALIEEQDWDVDYFAGCVYNRTRSDEEWKKVSERRAHGDVAGDLRAERSAAHVQGDAANVEAVLSLSRFLPPGASAE